MIAENPRRYVRPFNEEEIALQDEWLRINALPEYMLRMHPELRATPSGVHTGPICAWCKAPATCRAFFPSLDVNKGSRPEWTSSQDLCDQHGRAIEELWERSDPDGIEILRNYRLRAAA